MNKKNYEQVKSDYPQGTDSLWVSCHAAIGRMPTQSEFILWKNSRWNEFAANNGFISSSDQGESEVSLNLFRDWLIYTVSSGTPSDWKNC